MNHPSQESAETDVQRVGWRRFLAYASGLCRYFMAHIQDIQRGSLRITKSTSICSNPSFQKPDSNESPWKAVMFQSKCWALPTAERDLYISYNKLGKTNQIWVLKWLWIDFELIMPTGKFPANRRRRRMVVNPGLERAQTQHVDR